MLTIPVKTPCIGVCSTGIGDSVCRGCKRFAHEIIHWNSYSSAEQSSVVMRLEALVTQVVQQFLRVTDVDRLHQQIQRQQIRLSNPSANEYCQAYEAIRQLGARLPSLHEIGCAAISQKTPSSGAELKMAMDDAFFKLSCAHYERYFPGAL